MYVYMLLTLAGGELLKVLEGQGALGGEPEAGGMVEGGLEDRPQLLQPLHDEFGWQCQ